MESEEGGLLKRRENLETGEKEQTIMVKDGLEEVAKEGKIICPDPCPAGFDCLPEDNKEMDHRTDHRSAETPDQSSPGPEDSDFLTSVRLAAVLFLIFSMVSVLLFYSSMHQAPIRHRRRTGRPITNDYRLEQLRLLFPSQTDETWRTLEHKLGRQLLPDGRMSAIDIPFIAVAQAGSRNTLLCLAKKIISALSATEKMSVLVTTSKLAEFSQIHFCWRAQCINEWPVMFVAVVGRGKNGAPCGIHVGVHCSRDGGSSIRKTTLQLISAMRNLVDCMIYNTASDLVLEVLSSFNRTGRVPDMLWLKSVGSLPVMNVNVEDYLENYFVC